MAAASAQRLLWRALFWPAWGWRLPGVRYQRCFTRRDGFRIRCLPGCFLSRCRYRLLVRDRQPGSGGIPVPPAPVRPGETLCRGKGGNVDRFRAVCTVAWKCAPDAVCISRRSDSAKAAEQERTDGSADTVPYRRESDCDPDLLFYETGLSCLTSLYEVDMIHAGGRGRPVCRVPAVCGNHAASAKG